MARGVVRIAIANQRNESRLDCTRSRLKPSVHDFEKRERDIWIRMRVNLATTGGRRFFLLIGKNVTL